MFITPGCAAGATVSELEDVAVAGFDINAAYNSAGEWFEHSLRAAQLSSGPLVHALPDQSLTDSKRQAFYKTAQANTED